MSRENIHATGVLLDGFGVIFRGPPGAGKSLLALALLDDWEARGRAAQLVGDDRLDIETAAGGLTMRPPPQLAGLIELRGRGIVQRPFGAHAPVQLVVDLVDWLERMPEAAEFRTVLLGVTLDRCPVPRAGLTDVRHQMLLVKEALRALATRAGSAEKST